MNKWDSARICKQYSFSASHRLTGVPESHPCAKLHGHNYLVEIEVRGDVSPMTGFIIDFHDLDDDVKPVIAQLDHTHLNDILENPTAERIAQWILDNLPRKYVFSVKVWETPKAWAQVIAGEGLWYARDKVE